MPRTNHARDGGRAGTLFAGEQHLRQKGPQGQRGRLDLVVALAEGHAVGS